MIMDMLLSGGESKINVENGQGFSKGLDGKVVDIHMHILGIGDSDSGCKISDEMVLSGIYFEILARLGLTPGKAGDETIKNCLLDAINKSEKVDYAVLLSVDGVYKNGRYVDSETRMLVPNAYVSKIARDNRKVLLGASVHPYRLVKDLLAETERCIEEGAVLFSWLPSLQQINPEDDRCIPFYLVLSREGIPLLCHTGMGCCDHSSDAKVMSYCDPARLVRPLDIGVKVIAAHSFGRNNGSDPLDEEYFERLLNMLRLAKERGWDLYADISDICMPGGSAPLDRIRDEISRGRISAERFLYGSNFPLSKSVGSHGKVPSVNGREKNRMDLHYEMIEDSGLETSLFMSTRNVLKKRKEYVKT